MTRKEAVNWLINIMADIGKAEHRELWHYEQALFEIRELLEAQPEVIACGSGELIVDATGDLISRQGALDGKISIQRTNGVEMYSDEAVPVEYLKALPSAQPEQRWIPCSERLPDKSGMYLITEQNYGFKVDAICKNVVVHHSYFSVDEKEFKDTVYIPDCSNITAWMPLPEPYMRGEQDAEIR